jgi:serine/threonine protein phosphatase PrpC
MVDAEGFCTLCGYERLAAPGRMEVTVGARLAGVSDPGPFHERNEDFLTLASAGTGDILVVCDGVSNSQKAAAAAQAAAEAACAFLCQILLADTPLGLMAMRTAVQAADAAVRTVPYDQTSRTAPPETTLVAVVRQRRKVVLGWMGDSRAYHISARGATLLTEDHSWINEVVAAGEMGIEEARRSPQAHWITRSLGGPRLVDQPPDNPSVHAVSIPDGKGWLLLCTDGFWNCIPEPDQLAQLIHRLPARSNGLAMARELVQHAIERRSRDNITVAVLALTGDKGVSQ